MFLPILANSTDSSSREKLAKQAARISENTFVVLESRHHGMFSILDDVMSLLYAYEKKQIAGLEVDFGSGGLYYDSKHGPNWFSYYFEPVTLGRSSGDLVRTLYLPYSYDEEIKKLGLNTIDHIEFSNVDKHKVNRLIKKYIKIKPFIENEVSSFVTKCFKHHYMIGVHFRGTDKISEAMRTPYETVKHAIDQLVKKNNLSDYGIFVATDEEDFINYMRENYKDICYQDAIRSTTGRPIHFDNEDPFKAGEDALVDAILLSKTNFLIRTSSNLSRWSTYFNPDLPVLELSKRK